VICFFAAPAIVLTVRLGLYDIISLTTRTDKLFVFFLEKGSMAVFTAVHIRSKKNFASPYLQRTTFGQKIGHFFSGPVQ